MLDYNDLNEVLQRSQAQVDAAECHGFLSAQICIAGTADEELWREFLDLQTDDSSLIKECYAEVQLLMENIVGDIQSETLDFQLLMPDDDVTLVQRVNALGDWCYGFLNGFGVSEAESIRPLSPECREVLEDMTKISKVGLEDDADESDEKALMELIEYVRVGVMMMFEEFHPEIKQGFETGTLH